ncbi:MAG: pyridoxal-phosphate dependent enzyme [Planctomycetota bacterium]|jgi:cysteine synthase
MIDLTLHPKPLERAVARARERNILLPTFAQQRDPGGIPGAVASPLKTLGLWDLASPNLFRITWKNEAAERGGGFGAVNALELPPLLTGVDARILALVGKWFPTGSHKVGATFGALVPRLVTGQFDPTTQKAVWPSTGNFCRGGAYNAHLLGCESISILPEEMSAERFEWLSRVSGEIIATPGCESNVKEIFDKCQELEAERGEEIVIFNQFDAFGNYLWHYHVTGHAMAELIEGAARPEDNFRGVVLTTGSAGTLASGDYLKAVFPTAKVAASEALQCPTLLQNGFGGHRIEGIGDKHVPWIHNVRNTDLVMAVDDEVCLRLLRLFNEPAGKAFLADHGVSDTFLEALPWLGISSIANLLSCIKFAKWYELGENDIVLTVFTDSVELYGSRLEALRKDQGPYEERNAVADAHGILWRCTVDHMMELGHWERKRIHNLKYFTWVEQQGKRTEDLQAQWSDPLYWKRIHDQAEAIDTLIEEFNKRTGLFQA